MDTVDTSNHEYDPFDSYHLENVRYVELLPNSRAFEHLMYDHRVQRLVEYTMKNPIILSPTILNGKFPDELNAIFPGKHYEIRDLTIAQTEGDSLTSTSLNMSFTANDILHTLELTETSINYETENNHGEKVTYNLEKHTAISLLASFVYARQFDEDNPMSPLDLVENSIDIPRDPQTTMVEQLIMTLGEFDGTASIDTTAFFDIGNDIIVAKLIEGERPDMSSLISRIELTRLSFDDSSTIHQNTVNVKSVSGTLENRFAELHRYDVPEFIDPNSDYGEWSKICNQFYESIKKQLTEYLYLYEDNA